MTGRDLSAIPYMKGTAKRLKCILYAMQRIKDGATEAEVVDEFEHKGFQPMKAHDYYDTAKKWLNKAEESPEERKRLADQLKEAYEAGKQAVKSEKAR